jgi:hypothetical protein
MSRRRDAAWWLRLGGETLVEDLPGSRHERLSPGGLGPEVPAEDLGADELFAKLGPEPAADLRRGVRVPTFFFGKMFRDAVLPEFRPGLEGLVELGLAMEARPGDAPGLMPAGYVYLGQFVDHDLTFDQNVKLIPASGQARSLRSPSLDLDSLYGFDPELVKQAQLGRRLYEDDGIRLRFDWTQSDPLPNNPLAQRRLPNDLPRTGNLDPKNKHVALLIDPRNDENLAVAQTHLAFIKLHNAAVRRISTEFGLAGGALFESAREWVVRRYQWVVLKDFLPRIIEPEVLDEVIEKGPAHLKFREGEEPFMPIEFSVAAFRLGHSLINETYEWNPIFQSPPESMRASLRDLFAFTGFSGNLAVQKNLLSSWVIDWTRFYEFAGVGVGGRANRARRIGPSLVSGLMKLPPLGREGDESGLPPVNGVQPKDYLRSLSVRNLLRGHWEGLRLPAGQLPTGQAVAERLGVAALAPAEIAEGPHRDVLTRHGFDRLTPLWYYILREAERLHEGERLGPVGSRIVAETFVALIKKGRFSVLPRDRDGWPNAEEAPDIDSAPALLSFIDKAFEGENFLNPLGEA